MSAEPLPPMGDDLPELPGLDYNTVEDYIFDSVPAEDHAAEVARLKAEMLALAQSHTRVIEKYREDLTNLNNALDDRTVQLRRAMSRLVQVVRALRALCAHLDNQPITSLTYFGGVAFAKSAREAKEVLALCAGIE